MSLGTTARDIMPQMIEDYRNNVLGRGKTFSALNAGITDLFPGLSFTSGSVTPTISAFESDTYTAMIARWDAALPYGASYNGGSVTKQSLSPVSHDGNTIYAYKLQPANATQSIMLVTGIHGDERHAPFVALETAKKIFSGEINLGSTTVYIVPIANPDGWDLDTRENNNQSDEPTDINRNWGSNGKWSSAWDNFTSTEGRYKGASEYSEPETQALKALIDGTSDLTAVIDFHNFGSAIDLDARCDQATANDSAIPEILWAAKEAFGENGKIQSASAVSEPLPYMTNYAQGKGLYGIVLEIGPARVDTTVAADMAKAVNFCGNVLSVVASKPKQQTSERIGPIGRSIVCAASMNLTETTDWTDLTRPLGTTGTFTGLVSGTFTVDTANDELDDTGHGLEDGNVVLLSTSGTLPAGLSSNIFYYVVNASANSFQLSLTPGGSAVSITDEGSDTQTWNADILVDSAHGLSNGDTVQLTEDNTLPGGLAESTTYWVVNASTNNFSLSDQGPNGEPINLTDAGTSTNTWTKHLDYGLWVPVDFVGIAIGSWSFNFRAPYSTTTDRVYFRPWFGQNRQVFENDDANFLAAEERYHSAESDSNNRRSLAVTAQRLVLPSSQNADRRQTNVSDLQFRCQYKFQAAPSSGTATLYKMNATLTLIPFAAGSSYEHYEVTSTAVDQLY